MPTYTFKEKEVEIIVQCLGIAKDLVQIKRPNDPITPTLSNFIDDMTEMLEYGLKDE